MTETEKARMTPNQVVAWNLSQARGLRGWTQEEAAERLGPYLGQRWSKATYSAAERSITGERIRQFTADDIYAFARAFDLPMTFFLAPVSGLPEIGHPGSEETSTPEEVLDLVFGLNEAARKRLLDLVGISEEGSRALRRWADAYMALVDEREGQIDALLAARAALVERENESEDE